MRKIDKDNLRKYYKILTEILEFCANFKKILGLVKKNFNFRNILPKLERNFDKILRFLKHFKFLIETLLKFLGNDRNILLEF